MRLIGPKPGWARTDGGEAGLHPSNIHDTAYAIGTVDFTGDMPVILGPDGPSLGGFVCPATIVAAELWKIGQLKAGDTVRFRAVTLDDAQRLAVRQRAEIATLRGEPPSRNRARAAAFDLAALAPAARVGGRAGDDRSPGRRYEPARSSTDRWCSIWRCAFASTR